MLSLGPQQTKCNRPPALLIQRVCMPVLIRLTRSLAPSILICRAELWFLAAQQGPHRNGLIQSLAVSRHLFRGECVQLRIGLTDLFLLKVPESNQSESFSSSGTSSELQQMKDLLPVSWQNTTTAFDGPQNLMFVMGYLKALQCTVILYTLFILMLLSIVGLVHDGVKENN